MGIHGFYEESKGQKYYDSGGNRGGTDSGCVFCIGNRSESGDCDSASYDDSNCEYYGSVDRDRAVSIAKGGRTGDDRGTSCRKGKLCDLI